MYACLNVWYGICGMVWYGIVYALCRYCVGSVYVKM